MKQYYDLTIIGAGPTGLYAAYIAGTKKMNVKIIDGFSEVGGQLNAFYPEKIIHDLPGYIGIKAKDYVEQMHNQMMQVKSNVDLFLNEKVDYINKRDDDTFEICTDNICHISKTILIASGGGQFEPRRLGLPGEDSENVQYFIKKMDKFKGQNVVIFGGGDSAVDWALMLEGVAKKITLIHRRDHFRAHAQHVEKLKKSTVELHLSKTAKALDVEDNLIKRIILDDDTILDTNQVIVLFGFLNAKTNIEKGNVELESKGLLVNQEQQTSIKGIYAAGDACRYDGKVKRIATGFGEALTGVESAKSYIKENF